MSTPSELTAAPTRATGGAPSGDPKASRTTAPAPRPTASPARTSAGNAISSATAPSDAKPTSQIASSRTGRTSSGRATAMTATTHASRTSGEPPQGQGIHLEVSPFRINDLGEHAGDGGNQSKGEEQVANQQPPSSNESVHDDQERKRERDNNDRAPDPRGPTEQCGDRPSDLFVGLGSRPRDHRFEPGQSGCGRHKHAVDRPAIPSARLGRNEQREARRTRFRASLSTTGVGDRLHSVCWLGKPMPHL